jgi:hypothetical protein
MPTVTKFHFVFNKDDILSLELPKKEACIFKPALEKAMKKPGRFVEVKDGFHIQPSTARCIHILDVEIEEPKVEEEAKEEQSEEQVEV